MFQHQLLPSFIAAAAAFVQNPSAAPPKPAAATAPAPPLLSGPAAVEDNAGKLTLVHRTFDGRVESAGPQPDAVAIKMLDLSSEQRKAYDEINSARLTAFDQIVRSNYGLILELAALQGDPNLSHRTEVLGRVQTAFQLYTDRGTFYQEMWPHLTDAQRHQVETMLQEYREARLDSLKREASETDKSRERSLAMRERLEGLGQMVRESIDRQVGLERENFDQIANELGLSPEQKNKAEAIYQPLAIKRFQNIEVTKEERTAAFAEFSKLLDAGQKQKLFGMLVRQYQNTGMSNGGSVKSDARSSSPPPAAAPKNADLPQGGATAEAYKLQPGPSPVIERNITFTDDARHRDVPVKMYLPKPADHAQPVIIFSPGWGGSRDGYAYLARHWASHNYVTVVLDHLGSDTDFARKAVGDAGGAAAMSKLATALRTSIEDPTNWSNRALDVTFVLDQLKRFNTTPGEELFGRLDLAHVGMAGHSFGAYTTMLIMGALVDLPNQADRGFRDNRCVAGIAMSSQGDGRLGLDAKSWSNMHAPMLYFTGTKDYETGTGDVSVRRVAFDRTPADAGNPQMLVIIKDAEHMAFSDNDRGFAGEAIERNPAHHQWVMMTTTAFWDARLRGDAKAQAWITSDALSQLSSGKCAVERK